MTSKMAQLEALLYVAGDNGINQADLASLLAVSEEELAHEAQKLKEKLDQDPDSGLTLIEINHDLKLTTCGECGDLVETYFNRDLSKNISQSALEILAIIAYKQPITRVEIDEIRGVNSSGALQTLVWRGLVKAEGVKDVPGHPKLYVTTDYFLQYFGYKSLADLPVIENFEDAAVDSEGQVDLFADKNNSEDN